VKLIKKLKTKKIDNYYRAFALFLCPYCNKIIKKQLSNGRRNKSCGCMQSKFKIKHGDGKINKRLKLYIVWKNMKQRCYNKKNPYYKYYGERKIVICDEWKNDYPKFKKWALNNGYRDNLTIERINNDSNYEPSNCRFIILEEQARNKRNNKLNLFKIFLIRKLYYDYKIKRKNITWLFDVSSSHICRIINNKIWIKE